VSVKRGAKPLPTNIKRLHGTLRKHRLRGDEPQTRSEIPTCPRELSPAAKHEWRRIAPELAQLGLLARIDRAALALYCDAWGRWSEAQQALQKYGVVVKSPNGFPMQSPYLAIANKALEQMRLLLGEFGMSPSSRTRVSAMPQDVEDEFSEFERSRA
jgi:P27 family predicted phage terminase small subunit